MRTKSYDTWTNVVVIRYPADCVLRLSQKIIVGVMFRHSNFPACTARHTFQNNLLTLHNSVTIRYAAVLCIACRPVQYSTILERAMHSCPAMPLLCPAVRRIANALLSCHAIAVLALALPCSPRQSCRCVAFRMHDPAKHYGLDLASRYSAPHSCAFLPLRNFALHC